MVNYTNTPSFPLITDLGDLEKFEEAASDVQAVTQRSILSTVVEQEEQGEGGKGGGVINSTAGFVAAYLGKGKNEGKNAQVIGSYIDQWEAVGNQKAEAGVADYLIKKRDLFILGIVGDPAVVAP